MEMLFRLAFSKHCGLQYPLYFFGKNVIRTYYLLVSSSRLRNNSSVDISKCHKWQAKITMIGAAPNLSIINGYLIYIRSFPNV